MARVINDQCLLIFVVLLLWCAFSSLFFWYGVIFLHMVNHFELKFPAIPFIELGLWINTFLKFVFIIECFSLSIVIEIFAWESSLSWYLLQFVGVVQVLLASLHWEVRCSNGSTFVCYLVFSPYRFYNSFVYHLCLVFWLLCLAENFFSFSFYLVFYTLIGISFFMLGKFSSVIFLK